MPNYKVNDRYFDISDDKVDMFEADFPEAQLSYQLSDGRKFNISASQRKDFLMDFPDATEVGWGKKQEEPLKAKPMWDGGSYKENVAKMSDGLYYPSPLNEEGRAGYDPISTEERSKQEYEMLTQKLGRFNETYGEFMDRYEAFENVAKKQTNEGGFAMDTEERRYINANSEDYRLRKQERDEINDRIARNSYFNQMRMAEADAASEAADGIAQLVAQERADNRKLDLEYNLWNMQHMTPYTSGPSIKRALSPEALEYGNAQADLQAAERLYRKTSEIYAAPVNDGKQVLKAFGKGVADRGDDLDFWTMGLSAIADDLNTRQAFKKIQDKFGSVKQLEFMTDKELDELLTPSEQILISAYLDNLQAQAARINNTSGGYKAGQGAADSAMFMAQFLLTGGVGEAATAGTQVHKNVVNWLGRKIGSMNNGIAKSVARGTAKLGVGTAESIGKALVMTPLMPHTYANIADKMMSFDDKGELMDVTDALLLGASDALIETWSESTGDFVNKVLGVPGKLAKGMTKKYIKNVPFDAWGHAMNAPMMKLLRKGGFNGFLGEMGEEFIGNAVRSFTIDPNAFRDFAKMENLLVTAGSFAPMTIFGLGTSSAQYGWQKRKLANAQAAFEGILREASYTEDQIKFAVDELLGSTDAHLTPERLVQNFTPLLQELAYNDKFSGNRTMALDAAVKFMWEIARYRAYDGVYHKLEQDQARDMQAEILEGTGKEFWTTRLSSQAGSDGTAYETDEVRAVEFSDGRVAYVLGNDSRGSIVVYNDGKTGFLSEDQLNEGKANGSIVSDATMGLNDYLTQQVARVRMNAEEMRMFEERNDRTAQVRAQFPLGSTVQMSTTEAPIEGTVLQHNADGVVVETPAGISQLTWEELGHTIGIEVNPQTDAQMEEEAINNLEIADLQRRRERERRRAQKNEAAEAALAEAQAVDEAANEGLEKPIPMKADGTVDQTAFWNESPARWAEWKTEQRQDGGAYASTYIQNAIGILEGQIAENEAAFLAEADFDAKDALEQTIAQQKQRLAELADLYQRYAPAVAPAATQAEASAPATTEAEAETKAPEVLAEREKFELDAEYQRRLSITKSLTAKVMILQEYFDVISGGSVVTHVVTKDNYRQVMKDNGCEQSDIDIVKNAISDAEKTNKAVNALHLNDAIYVVAEYNSSVENGRLSFVHERQHNITGKNHGLIERVLALGLGKDVLANIVKSLSGSDFYTNKSEEVLADEVLSFAMEYAYTYDDFSLPLSMKGLPIELINLIKEINDEQRNDHTLANARRSKAKYDNPQDNRGQDGGNQAEVSGRSLGQEGDGSDEDSGRRTRAGSEGERNDSAVAGAGEAEEEEVLAEVEPEDNGSFRVTKPEDENGVTAEQNDEINRAIGGEIEVGDEESPVRFSLTAIGHGAGLELIKDDGKGNVALVLPDGRKFNAHNLLKPEDIKSLPDTVLSYMMKDARMLGNIDARKEWMLWQKYTLMLNAILSKGSAENGGFEHLASQWQWIADTVYKTVATNSDTQYSFSLDITRVCKKNEAVINAIAEMQARLGYGITPGQIMDIYMSTIEEGYQVPCPVCYVFSRYIRNGKYATIMINGQRKYGSKLVDPRTLSEKEKEKLIKYWLGEKKKIEDQNEANKNEIARANSDITTLLDEIDKLSKQITDPRSNLTEEQKAKILEKIHELDARYKAALNVVSQSSLDSWITQFAIYKKKEGGKEKWVLYEDSYMGFPEEMALDLRQTSTVMRLYPAIQRFRKSRGAAAGKEITFVSNNDLGDVALALGSKGATESLATPREMSDEEWAELQKKENGSLMAGQKNLYQQAVEEKDAKKKAALLKKASERFASASEYAKRQSLRGGQRMWSWSDNIERLAPDVFVNLFQMEMLGGALQSYSKQLEGIKLVASMNGYVNGSLMGKGNGYAEVSEENVEEVDGKFFLKGGDFVMKQKNGKTTNLRTPVYKHTDGKFYVLEFDDVVGIDAFGKDENGKHFKGLFELNAEYDKAGNILVGMNDLHIRIAMADDRIFFIIPWHSSGANSHILAQMYEYLGVEYDVTLSQDYTDVQSEKRIKGPGEKEDEDTKAEDGKEKKETTPVSVFLAEFWNDHHENAREYNGYGMVAGKDFPCGIEGGIASSDGNGNLSADQMHYRELRDAIFMGVKVPTGKTDKNGKPTYKNVNVEDYSEAWFNEIMNDAFLSQVYAKVREYMGEDGRMTSQDTKAIYPYEYWDETSTFATSSINGARYMEYCRRLGYKPKFCGKLDGKPENDYGNFTEDAGYWKNLIDRRMYAVDGKFQGLTPVTAENFTPDLVDPEVTKEEFVVTRVADEAGTQTIVDRAIEKEKSRPGGIATVNYDMSLDQALKAYTGAESVDLIEEAKKAVAKADAKKKSKKGKKSEDIRFRVRTDEQREKLFEDAKAHYGVTKNFNAAGYMLPDGSLLDFSEANDGGDPNSRSLDHRDIEGIIMDNGVEYDSRWMYIADFMNEGAIRLLPESAGINMIQAPTEEQRKKIFDFIYKYNGEVILEINDERLNSVVYMEYDRRTSPARILRDIDGYFNDGIVPQQDVRFRISNQNQAIFVSNAAKAVEGIKQEKATPEQWLKMIEKAGGLKAGEDKWMGISDWLKASDKKTLTKQEVLDFINENMIIIEETHYKWFMQEEIERASEANMRAKYGDEFMKKFFGDAFIVEDDMYRGWRLAIFNEETAVQLYNEANGTSMGKPGEYGLETEDYDIIVKWGTKIVRDAETIDGVRPINETRQTYQSKGLTGRHEIALTVPTIESWNEDDAVHFGEAGEGRAVAWIRFGETIAEVRTEAEMEAWKELDEFTKELYAKYGDSDAWTLEESKKYSDILDKTKAAKEQKKVLVIDEIQSKRHQDAREMGGYRVPNVDKWLADHGIEVKETGEFYEFYHSDGEMDRRYSKGLLHYNIEEAKKLYVSGYNRSSVPDAPFEKNWHELAMKRMLRYAAENGYDAVAWTKGDQQNKRYNLSKVVDHIQLGMDFTKQRESSFRMYLKNGNEHHVGVDRETGLVTFYNENKKAIGKPLSELLGKELAEKVLGGRDYQILTEVDFELSEGMKGFYDKILPAFMNKYGKQWGVKVSNMYLNRVEEGIAMHSIPVTEEMKASVMEGQVMFRVRGENESAEEFAQSMIKDFKEKYDTKATIITLDPTSKEQLAKFAGVPVESISDEMLEQLLRDIEKEDKRAWINEDTHEIAIFVRESVVDGKMSELVLIHENIHDIIARNSDLLALGKYLWENAEKGSKEYRYRREIQKRYSQGRWYTEMAAYVISERMQDGTIRDLVRLLDLEHENMLNKLLNISGYGKERKAGSVWNVLRKRHSSKSSETSEREPGKPGNNRFRVAEIAPEVRAEMDVISATAIINGNYLKAPNGKDTKLTPEQWAMVRTKNFKAWYGDWENDPENASKVVDENGEPMVVYHGTGKEYGFTIFNTNPDNQNLGSHFGTAEAARVFDSKGNHTYEVFLNIRNPWSSSVEDFWTDDEETYAFVIAELANHLASQGNEEAAEIYNKTVAQYPMAKDSETWLKWFETGEGRTYKYMSNLHISLRRLLEIGGYDGWMYENFVEDAGSISWVALYPSQIKSATDNTGGFSPTDPDIRFRVNDFRDAMDADEFFDALSEVSNYGSGGASRLISALEDYYGGTLVSASDGARRAMKDGLLPKPGKKFSGVDGEYHHMRFRNADGEDFVESVPFTTVDILTEEEPDIRFRIRTKPAPQKTGIGYKVFYLKDGKLYPPMVANQGGVDTPVGVWLDAEEGTRAGVSKTGRPKVKQGGKGTQGGSGTLAYRPGWHLGEIPYAIQFNRKDENGDRTLFPADFVWAEVEYANDVDYQEEAMSYGMNANGKFQHSLAGLPKLPTDGSYRYRTNPNPETDPWIITGAMKVNRILTPSEVDQMVIDAGREPQKRQEDAVTDEQIEALNKELGLVENKVSFRVTGTPTDEIVASGLSLSPAQTADLAGNIFAALPESARAEVTASLNGDILGLQDAIMQIPARLAMKENWDEEDRKTADAIAEQLTDVVGKEMTRPFSAPEALWLLYNALNKPTDLVSEAQRSLVQRNLGFDAQTQQVLDDAGNGVRFRTVGNASVNATAHLYNRGSVNVWTRIKESFVDMNASVEKLVKAIEKNSRKAVQGFENVLMALNQQSSRGLAAMESYTQNFLNPMFDEISKIMRDANKKYEDVVRYVILKHGLERNIKLAARDARAYYQEIYDDIIAKIKSMNDAQKRTYLTNAQLKNADAKAELTRLQAVDQTTLTEDQLRELKRDLAKARKAVAETDVQLERARKIRNMSEQEAKDELDKIFENIEKGKDGKFQELRKNDYSGISSMFYDQLGVDRTDWQTEEEYQAELMRAKQDRFNTLADVEAEAQKEVTDFEKAAKTNNLWKAINAATKETLRQQFEANMISRDQYNNLRDMFEFYVPLRGFADNTAEDMYTYYRKPNTSGYTKPILGAEGRKTEAESPFGWIASMAGSAIASNVKNEAKLALFYFVSNRPDNGIATVSKTWYVHTPGDVDANGKRIFKPAYPTFNEDLTGDLAKQAYEDWIENMKELQKQGLAYESGQRLNLGNAVVNIDSKNQPEHIITVKVGGKDYTILINGNPRAAQAINGDLNIEATAGDYSMVFGPMLRWMSSVNTSYNPEFWITNMMRDMLFTTMAVSIKESPAYRRKFAKNYAKALKVVKLNAQNEEGNLGNDYLDRMYKDFVKYGGVTGYTQIKDNETWESEIEKYLKSNNPSDLKAGVALKKMQKFFHGMHRFGESLEQISRFAAFVTSREMGKSMTEAINDAKEITVNFNRKGSGKMVTYEESKYLTDANGQPLNKFERWLVVGFTSIAPLGRRFIMFFNAAIQGLNATYQLWKKNKVRSTAWALGYAAVGVMNAVLHALLDDDDDYLDIPEYERRNSLMIGWNGTYAKWALPQEARAFYALGDLAVETLLGRNKHKEFLGMHGSVPAFLSGVTSTFGEILPINPTEGWKAFMPSIAIPFIEIALNKDYKGAPIYNDLKWLTEEERARTERWAKAYRGTGKMYIDMSKLLNNLTDSSDLDEVGFINLPPEVIEHIVQSAFGGTIRTVDKFINTVTAAIDPETDVTVRQFPFVNRFVTINDERYKNVHVNDVYDYYAAEAEYVIDLQNKYNKEKDFEAAERLKQTDEYEWMKIYKKHIGAIKRKQDEIKAAEGNAERARLMKEQDELKRQMIKEISQLP